MASEDLICGVYQFTVHENFEEALKVKDVMARPLTGGLLCVCAKTLAFQKELRARRKCIQTMQFSLHCKRFCACNRKRVILPALVCLRTSWSDNQALTYIQIYSSIQHTFLNVSQKRFKKVNAYIKHLSVKAFWQGRTWRCYDF